MELLVVIGIIGLLIAILLPALSGVRQAARDTQCASQLHQLTLAATLHLNEFHEYPAPPFLPAIASAGPSAMTEVLFNALGRQLRWTPRTITAAVTVPDLPIVAVCPVRRNLSLFQEADTAHYGVPIWITGYCYFARVDEAANNAFGALLRPGSVAVRRGRSRGVIWTDTLAYTRSGPSAGYSAFHIRGSLAFEPTTGTIGDPHAIRGQHRASDDGSVTWTPASAIDLSPERLEQSAAYKIALPNDALTLWYWL